MLLNGNPLDDIRNTTRIAGVMVNGASFSRTKLDTQLRARECAIR